MRRRIYIIDVIDLNYEGGAGLASWTMISNLREFYEIVFIPKYVEFKGDSLLKSIDSIRSKGLVFPEPLAEYARNTSIYKYGEYMAALLKSVEGGSVVMDMNYFPYLAAPNGNDVLRDLFFYGEAYDLHRLRGCRVITLLQTLDNRKIWSHLMLAIDLALKLNYFDARFLMKSFYRTMKDLSIKKKLLKFSELIIVYSKGSIVSMLAEKRSDKFRVMSVGNTLRISPNSCEKERYIFFYARLIPEKGIFDLLPILREVMRYQDTRLLIAGAFHSGVVKKMFFEMMMSYGLEGHVDYLGFLPIESLRDYVSRAKVLLYPSHYDSFSYVMLESLASGTAVVTYENPAISYKYENVEAVKFVKEFDFDGMARATVEFLNMDDERYKSMFRGTHTDEFVRMHLDPKYSVKEIAQYISELYP